MVGRIFDDVRRILMGLLFFVAFGWMAAQVLPGQMSGADGRQTAQATAVVQLAQVTLHGEMVPPRP
jgi:hypothetical protein